MAAPVAARAHGLLATWGGQTGGATLHYTTHPKCTITPKHVIYSLMFNETVISFSWPVRLPNLLYKSIVVTRL